MSHFTADFNEPDCGRCDVCEGRASEVMADAQEDELEPVIEALTQAEFDAIEVAVERLKRPVDKMQLVHALRGGRAKNMSRGGLLSMPEYASLAHYSEDSVLAAVDDMLTGGQLVRHGPNRHAIWVPGKVQQRTEKFVSKSSSGSVRYALDSFCKQTARQLGWKPHMVLPKKTIVEIDEQRPLTTDDLYEIDGLNSSKIERFGKDIIEIVESRTD